MQKGKKEELKKRRSLMLIRFEFQIPFTGVKAKVKLSKEA